MDTFKKNRAIVIDCLKRRDFSEASVNNYEKIYSSIEHYLNERGVIYSPKLGEEMLLLEQDAFFTVKGILIRTASIRKLNDVYLNGCIKNAVLSSHKKYRNIELVNEFDTAVSDYLSSVRDKFSSIQQINAERRIRLFFKFLQAHGICTLDEISYASLLAYHEELSYLKPSSRMVEESSIHQILHLLSDQGKIDPGRYLYMYLLEKGYQQTTESLTADELQKINEYRFDSLCFSSEMFLQNGRQLVNKYRASGYVDEICKDVERTIHYLYLFLDLNGLGYLPEIAEIWLNSENTKKIISGSSWKIARRTLCVFQDMLLNGEPDFGKVYRRGISGLDGLPDWCKIPLMDYADLRSKEKLEDTTVKNDIFSILRFLRFILGIGRQSFMELTGEDIVEFNLKDLHGTPEGKNSCNARIRRFLKYLGSNSYLSCLNLYMSLSTTAASVETVVKIFTDEEIGLIRKYVDNAETSLEIRDSAIMLLGCDMGVRGCDIVGLRLRDIDWRKQCIHFRQDKTDVDVILSMPTAVGNAIFRYLRDVRNKGTDDDHVFVSINAPFSSITRGVCYGTLHRILPNRKVPGSGFHATRKTFSTNRLKSGVNPELIADALGHKTAETLTPYLSLDNERMTLCPLSLECLSIQMKGGFR